MLGLQIWFGIHMAVFVVAITVQVLAVYNQRCDPYKRIDVGPVDDETLFDCSTLVLIALIPSALAFNLFWFTQ